jgi:hypothetical protein
MYQQEKKSLGDKEEVMEKTKRKWSARITDGRTIGRKCAFVVGLHNDSVYEDCIASIELNHKEDADGWFEKYNRIAECMNTCSELKAKAEAYDRLMSGGNKTPKEVANFFGKPIAMDMDGEWRVFYDCIPTIKGCCWTPTEMYEYDVIPSILIDFTGDWKDSLTLPDGWEEK